jgi:hypothetical protein
MDKPEFYVTLGLWELNHNKMQWGLHIMPMDSHVYDEHTVYFDSVGSAAAYIRMIRELGAKLHIRRDSSVTSVFDKQWTDFKSFCAHKK